MNFKCQSHALHTLQDLANMDRHSVLIEGPKGSGKTYLAHQYASMLGVTDFQIIANDVNSIRTAIVECYKISNKIVICIENLDAGVAAASHALLKFLEEPAENVYIVVTCRNRYGVPDTIISRSMYVIVSPPIVSDICEYAQSLDNTKYMLLKDVPIWKCIRTFEQVNVLFKLTIDQLDYIETLPATFLSDHTVSGATWRLGHYSDNSETPIELVVSYIMISVTSLHIKKAALDCLDQLASNRIASHAVLTKFVFNCLYVEE